ISVAPPTWARRLLHGVSRDTSLLQAMVGLSDGIADNAPGSRRGTVGEGRALSIARPLARRLVPGTRRLSRDHAAGAKLRGAIGGLAEPGRLPADDGRGTSLDRRTD